MRALLTLSICMALSAPSFALASDDLSAIKSELMALLQRVESLEAENKQLRASVQKTNDSVTEIASTASSNSSKSSWTDTIQLKGDFRYRYENIDAERSDTRERNRIRARASVVAKPFDNTEIGIGVASGGDDPVSTNQTLGGGGSTKDIRLDLAYFKWEAKPGFHVIGGKMKNIFRRVGGNGLVWDGDYRPEGLAFTWKKDDFFFDTQFNFLESDSRRSNSEIAYGFQTGINKKMDNGAKLLAGISYFDISVDGREIFSGDIDDFFGNSFTCASLVPLDGCTYDTDFEEIEIFAQYDTTIGEKPLRVFADYVQNQATSDNDTAYAVGVKLGKASNPSTWEVGYTYQDIEADALFGLVTDSDFAGGGTDAKGHILRGAWAMNKKWKIGFTYFNNERNLDFGIEEDYQRLMIDTAYKF